MQEKHQVDLTDLVPHPRYGAYPRVPVAWWSRCLRALVGRRDPSGMITTEWVRTSYGYQPELEIVFPATSLPANTKKQNFSVIPREFYIDVLKACRDCKRHFIFFAKEQRYWYEDLGFSIYSDCVRCPECRKSDRLLRRRFARYSQRVNDDNMDDVSLRTSPFRCRVPLEPGDFEGRAEAEASSQSCTSSHSKQSGGDRNQSTCVVTRIRE